jgi:predicted fused transcriptional regulator/phosphomethylpyrimidine kinase
MTKIIVFPAMDTVEEAKIKRLSETMAEFMVAKIEVKSVVMLAVEVEDDRPDVAAVFGRLVAAKKNAAAQKDGKPKAETPK